MQITYQRTRENEDDVTVWWTLTDDALNEYQWHGDIPKDVDIQGFIESQMETYLKLIRRREYPDMPKMELVQGQTELEAMEQWIADGAWIDGQTQAVKVPWTNTHPKPERIIDGKKISVETLEVLDAFVAKYPEGQAIKEILVGNS